MGQSLYVRVYHPPYLAILTSSTSRVELCFLYHHHLIRFLCSFNSPRANAFVQLKSLDQESCSERSFGRFRDSSDKRRLYRPESCAILLTIYNIRSGLVSTVSNNAAKVMIIMARCHTASWRATGEDDPSFSLTKVDKTLCQGHELTFRESAS